MSRFQIAAGASVLALATGYQLASSPAAGARPTRQPTRPAVTMTTQAVQDLASAQNGQPLYAAHCAVCHGKSAQGKIGPNIVKKTLPDINNAISTVSMMSSLSSLSQQDRADIAAYLQSLE